MRPITVSVGPLEAASNTAICQSQTPAAAGNLLINGSEAVGGVAILDAPRRVQITSVDDESPVQFTITGTDRNGNVISETFAGPNAASKATSLDYKTVTSVYASAATADAVTVGTNSTASSQWVYFDAYAFPQISIQVNPSDATVTVQQTLDDPNDPSNPVPLASMVWINHPDAALVNASSDVQGNYAYTPAFARLTLTGGAGSATVTFIQSGSVVK
jgi:hypothetical protein